MLRIQTFSNEEQTLTSLAPHFFTTSAAGFRLSTKLLHLPSNDKKRKHNPTLSTKLLVHF